MDAFLNAGVDGNFVNGRNFLDALDQTFDQIFGRRRASCDADDVLVFDPIGVKLASVLDQISGDALLFGAFAQPREEFELFGEPKTRTTSTCFANSRTAP